MLRSTGTRFLIVGILTLLMFIPLFFVGEVVDDRVRYSRSTAEEVGREWGGEQTISGPRLVVPVSALVVTTVEEKLTDPETGEVTLVNREKTVREGRRPITFYPDNLAVTIDALTQLRSRGIFDVPVYTADVQIDAGFTPPQIDGLLSQNETAHWSNAELTLGLGDNRALRGDTTLWVNGAQAELEPAEGTSGVVARIDDPTDLQTARFAFNLNGAENLMITPVGRLTEVTMTSDWPHPSFFGDFLPDGSEISEEGFSTAWTIPHLARNIPKAMRGSEREITQLPKFGVKFYTPNDFYQKAYRASSYSILFIALTFLSVFLIEGRSQRPAHPAQYILIGLAQAIFILLMVAYAEQFGFATAYIGSSIATIGLITLYGAIGLGLGKRSMVLCVMLTVLYAVLYLILQSTDYALLAGSSLAFIALLTTMVMTRNEEWYGEPKDRGKPGFLKSKFTKKPEEVAQK